DVVSESPQQSRQAPKALFAGRRRGVAAATQHWGDAQARRGIRYPHQRLWMGLLFRRRPPLRFAILVECVHSLRVRALRGAFARCGKAASWIAWNAPLPLSRLRYRELLHGGLVVAHAAGALADCTTKLGIPCT